MFKKFKDKLAEEMKQSPSRLQAGMQQLAQAVISPAASNNLIQDVSATTSVDDLNLTSSEEADTLRDDSTGNQFQSVDLLASNSMERSRRSSFSSVTSDNFFPTYESPGNLYHLQSDMEQSASEFEDGSTPSQLERVTKEELYAGYRKLRTKYTKYRAVYRELYKENTKMKSVLVETQDKALRRIANLKEQCQLEQEAKAHLEGALRNDIEEKDHLIDALATKIKLLRANGSSAEDPPAPEPDGQSQKSNFDLLSEPTDAPGAHLAAENTALKEKVKKFEVLLAKCNESLKKNKEKISQLTEDRDILERDLNILRNGTTERTEMLESEIYKAKREILSLNEQVDVFRKREEDSALSLAENKLFIHRELEAREEQNKRLQEDLKKIGEYKDILAEAVVGYDREFKRFEIVMNDRGVEADEKISQLQDLFSNKSEALKLIQRDVKRKFLGDEEGAARTKRDDEGKRKKDSHIVTHVRGAADEGVAAGNEEISRSRDELEIKNAQLLGLATELKSCKSTMNDLKEMLRDVTMDWEQEKREKECLIANILEYKRILGELRRDCDSVKVQVKESYRGREAIVETVSEKLATVLNTVAGNYEAIAKAAEKTCQESELDNPPPSSDAQVSSVELKTIVNESNALRKKCEQLTEQNERMTDKVEAFDKVNSMNVKLIAEIDQLNFKQRDIAELRETQDKLQSEMEALKGRAPFGNNPTADNNDPFANQVSFLRDKLDNYDALGQENAALKRQLVELKNKLAANLNDMEVFKLEQSKTAELGVENFSRKCAEYENMILGLSAKFTEQTVQLERLHDELAKQKTSFRELSDRYEARNSEFQETRDAFALQASEMKELDDKYKTQCSEIESLREKETEILKRLGETVKVREEMIAKFDELEACKNETIERKNKELEELALRHENMLKESRSSEEMKIDLVTLRTNEIEILTKEKAELTKEIERLTIRNGEIEILGDNNNRALRLELDELKASNAEVMENNKELKEERNNLVKLNAALEISENDLRRENDELKEKVSDLGNQVELLGKRFDAERLDMEQRISELNKEVEKAREEVRTTEDKDTQLREELDALKARESQEAASKEDVETKNKTLAAQVSKLQKELEEFDSVRRSNLELEKQVEHLAGKVKILNDAEAKNADSLKEIEELNRRIDTLANCEDENRAMYGEIETLRCGIAELEAQKSESMELRGELKILHESKAESMTEVANLRRENDNLALRIENLQVSLDQKEAEMNLLKNANVKLAREFEEMNSLRSKTLEDESKIISELEKRAEDCENRIVEHLREVEELKITNKELEDQLAGVNADHSNALQVKTERIAELERTAEVVENQLAEHRREMDASRVTNKELEDQVAQINFNHAKALDDKTSKIAELEKRAEDIEHEFIERKREVDAERIINKELREQLGQINADHSRALEDKARTITELEKAAKDVENKLIGRREQVQQLEATNKDLREELSSVSRSQNADEALRESYNRLRDENKELQTRLDEAVILYEAKESQIEIMSEELRRQTRALTDKLKTNEEEQSMRIKQLVKEFQAQIHDKDEQIQAALEKRFERQQNYESELIQQYKEQLKDFQIELTAKSEQIESLILDNKGTVQAYKDQIDELTRAIADVKKEHSDELQEIDRNWKAVLKQRTDQLETKHVDEVNELTKEWLTERKAADNSDTSPGELESTSRVAMATIQSNTGSFHSLQQTLISQKRELSELRKLLRIRNESLEGSTEIEYLRNILFEYMMGRETLVLTRVISAVVKFDQEQTSKVLKKEEDKLTLVGLAVSVMDIRLGSLGLL